MFLMPAICGTVAEGVPQLAGSGPLQGQLPTLSRHSVKPQRFVDSTCEAYES